MHSIEFGRIAEAKVVAVLVEQGHEVYVPAFGNGTCDLIAIVNNVLTRIEVKYVSRPKGPSSWEADLRQHRHNRTSEVRKKFNDANSDVLAAYLAPRDQVLFFEASQLGGRSTLTVNMTMAPTHGRLPL